MAHYGVIWEPFAVQMTEPWNNFWPSLLDWPLNFADIMIMGLTVCSNSVLIIWKSSIMWQTFYNDIWAKTAWEFPCWQLQQTRKWWKPRGVDKPQTRWPGDFVYYFNEGLCPPKLLKILFFILLLITTLSGWYMHRIICDVDLERSVCEAMFTSGLAGRIRPLRPWIHKSRIRPLGPWIHTGRIRPLRPR